MNHNPRFTIFLHLKSWNTERKNYGRMGIFAHIVSAAASCNGRITAQAIYTYKFLKMLWHLVSNLGIMDENTVMFAVLNLIGVVMIANLLTMVII